MSFPVDTVTLEMLCVACRVGLDGRSHLSDFMDMMSTMGGATDEIAESFDSIHIMADSAWRYSTSDVIEALANEILRLRSKNG